MEANKTDIKTVSDVRLFITKAIQFFHIYIPEDELYENVVNVFLSDIAGVPRKLLMKMEQTCFEDEDDYDEHIRACEKVYKHPKTVFDRLYRGISLFDNSHFYNNRNASEDTLSKLRDVEEFCRELCEEESYDYDEIVVEELEEYWNGNTPLDIDDYPDTWEEEAREANRLFYGEIDDNEAWGNLD